jgi:hypothetical protein
MRDGWRREERVGSRRREERERTGEGMGRLERERNL